MRHLANEGRVNRLDNCSGSDQIVDRRLRTA